MPHCYPVYIFSNEPLSTGELQRIFDNCPLSVQRVTAGQPESTQPEKHHAYLAQIVYQTPGKLEDPPAMESLPPEEIEQIDDPDDKDEPEVGLPKPFDERRSDPDK